MMSKKRIREEIMVKIVESTIDGANAHKIMCNSFVNYNQLKRYIRDALLLELIKVDGNIYKITPKGMKYIELFGGVSSLRWDDANRR